ncbi:Mannan endo-1,6-alpha-mannosidase [Alternaria arborescens]|uniref:Mannan endo-1,6-alpha-mannosidase n=1 Tax=Alternaria arborescens TaxID=156630 RepID=A0A4Q4QXV7_9PLEO|nr:Mannan endo-1,6-alpha-mannosidase [Alternaria arborescens]RYN24565.1 Mannan endo-1,6-alpha-mannosidase [Alternaria arborescens]RYO17547.1 Mannan endo-1,6-alpha-mannosidase [Alternaria arborescens]RYO48076.1 Mannan endo-1,6-alpha-mannosidase [Alternaria arborescens]
MKLRYALGVIYASTLSLSGVCAIELDVDSPDSIKNAAKVLSTNLRRYYTGDRLGDVPGNLPDPYYWWECGAMFNAFIDYWYYTGDDQYNVITEQALQHQIGDYNAFMPPNQTRTLGNDDQAFWGMAAMSAAENKLPDVKDGPSWLSLAQAVFQTQHNRWNTEKCGGGLKWQIFFTNPGYTYKNTISNGCFFNIAARLYKYLGNDTYSDWAEKTWEWEQSIGLISSDFHFFDGTGDSENCTSIKKIQWTYNAGVHISGAAAMWNVTQNQLWKDRVQGILNGLDVFFKDGVMTEVACENNGMCNVDQRSFKAYLARWLGYTAIVAPWTREQIDPLLKASAKAAAAQCNAGADQASCGLRWTKNGINDGSFGVGEQMAALEIVQALLYPTVDGPATTERGGISQSNPNAGIEAPNDDGSTHFDSISTRDRVGASVLTVLVVGGSLVGAWWMVS